MIRVPFGKALWSATFLANCALAGIASAQTNTAAWDQVIAAAKKEGQVSVYTADVGSVCGPARLKAFEDKYGIKVNTLAARGTEVDERVRTEQSSGRSIGDVYANGTATALLREAAGSFQPYGDIPNLSLLLPDYKPDGQIIPDQDLLYGILVNTTEVKPADVPKTWKDLADPKWKGKILADDFRVTGNGNFFVQATGKLYGDGFLQKMADQNVVFDRDVGNDGKRVAAGEYLIYMPLMASYYPRFKGLPLTFVFPEDGSPENIGAVAMLKGAPHPNAARLMINYYLDPEWNANCANEGRKSVTKLDMSKLNDFAKQVAAEKLLGPPEYDAAKQQQWLDKAKQLYK